MQEPFEQAQTLSMEAYEMAVKAPNLADMTAWRHFRSKVPLESSCLHRLRGICCSVIFLKSHELKIADHGHDRGEVAL